MNDFSLVTRNGRLYLATFEPISIAQACDLVSDHFDMITKETTPDGLVYWGIRLLAELTRG